MTHSCPEGTLLWLWAPEKEQGHLAASLVPTFLVTLVLPAAPGLHMLVSLVSLLWEGTEAVRQGDSPSSHIRAWDEVELSRHCGHLAS